MQKLMISGRVGKDPVLRHTQGGDAVLGFSLAVDNGKDKDGNKRDATWYDAAIWGKRATSLQAHIRKGDGLSLIGRPTAREHDGKAYLGISVDDLTFMGSSNRDSASNNRSDYGQGGTGGPPGGGPMPDDEIPFAPEWKV